MMQQLNLGQNERLLSFRECQRLSTRLQTVIDEAPLDSSLEAENDNFRTRFFKPSSSKTAPSVFFSERYFHPYKQLAPSVLCINSLPNEALEELLSTHNLPKVPFPPNHSLFYSSRNLSISDQHPLLSTFLGQALPLTSDIHNLAVSMKSKCWPYSKTLLSSVEIAGISKHKHKEMATPREWDHSDSSLTDCNFVETASTSRSSLDDYSFVLPPSEKNFYAEREEASTLGDLENTATPLSGALSPSLSRSMHGEKCFDRLSTSEIWKSRSRRRCLHRGAISRGLDLKTNYNNRTLLVHQATDIPIHKPKIRTDTSGAINGFEQAVRYMLKSVCNLTNN